MNHLPDDFTVRLTDRLPLRVGGFVCESPDGHINIYINARLSRARQCRALRHELAHIERDDLHSDRSIYDVEGVRRPVRDIPDLKRAADLLPPPPPPKKPSPRPLDRRQERLLLDCLASLDAVLCRDLPDW